MSSGTKTKYVQSTMHRSNGEQGGLQKSPASGQCKIFERTVSQDHEEGWGRK